LIHQAKDAKVWMYSRRTKQMIRKIGGDKIALVRQNELSEFYNIMEYSEARRKIDEEIKRVAVKIPKEELDWWVLDNEWWLFQAVLWLCACRETADARIHGG